MKWVLRRSSHHRNDCRRSNDTGRDRSRENRTELLLAGPPGFGRLRYAARSAALSTHPEPIFCCSLLRLQIATDWDDSYRDVKAWQNVDGFVWNLANSDWHFWQVAGFYAAGLVKTFCARRLQLTGKTHLSDYCNPRFFSWGIMWSTGGNHCVKKGYVRMSELPGG